jgi:hypothetical protein
VRSLFFQTNKKDLFSTKNQPQKEQKSENVTFFSQTKERVSRSVCATAANGVNWRKQLIRRPSRPSNVTPFVTEGPF